LRFIVLFCLAVLLLGWLPELPPTEPLRLLLALHLCVWLCLSPRRRLGQGFSVRATRVLRFWQSLVSGLLPVMLALTFCVHWGQAAIDDRLAESESGRRFWVEGCVASLVSFSRGSQRFEFEPIRAWRIADTESAQAPIELPNRLRLSWFFSAKMETDIPKAGECWRLALRLKAPHGFGNPGSFDYRRWLLSRGIGATGYVLNRHNRQALDNRRLSVDRWSVGFVRQRLLESLSGLLNKRDGAVELLTMGARGEQAQAMLKALLVGDRSQISEERKEQLARTGLSHLLAISGLHIGLAASFGYLLVFTLARVMSVAAPLRVFAPRWAIYGALLFAGIYAALAGFSLPTQRALTMLVCLSLWRLLLRHQSLWQAWWLSVLLVLVLQPLAGFDAGFWLSFVAVAALIAGFQAPSARQQGRWRGLWYAQWCVFIGLLLPLWASGLGISVWSPLVNAAAIPWVSVFVVPPLLLGALLLPLSQTLSQWLWQLAHWALDKLLWALDGFEVGLGAGQRQFDAQLAVFPGYSGVEVGTAADLNVGLLVCSALMLLFFFLPKGLPGRFVAVFALGLLLLLQLGSRSRAVDPIASNHWSADAPKLWVLDVGQGLALVVNTVNGAVLFDAGGASGRGFDAGKALVLPFLQKLSITKLHTAVISHADRDHAGGWPAVQEAMPVKNLWLGELEKSPALPGERRAVHTNACSRDVSWRLSSVRFDLLANPLAEDTSARPNDRSCVLLVSTAEQRVLIPGDIGAEQEAYFARHPKLQGGITGLIAPHHGSLSSSSEYFLDHLKPEWVVVSAGYLSRYGHPHQRVTQRYRARDIQVFNTADQGALSLGLSKPQAPQSYLLKVPRYWY